MSADGALAVAIRLAHLAALALAAGGLVLVRLLGQRGPAGPGGLATRSARVAVGVALLALAVEVALRLASATGRPLAEALDGGALGTLLTETWYGRVVLVRMVLGGLALLLPWPSLAVLLLATAPLAGHVAGAESAALRAWQTTAGCLHVVAAGVWLGALPFLAVALHRAGSAAEVDRLARRFSGLGVASVSLLVAAGLALAYALVGSLEGLVGTPYGRLLLGKIALLLPLLGLASRNLLGPRSGLARRVRLEAALGGAAILLAAALAATPPARHVDPLWPFAVRLTGALVAGNPGLESRLLTGALLALLGLSALVFAALFPGQRRGVLVAGAAGLAAAWGALWPLRDSLLVDAYPTTYVRPPVPYEVTSLAAGLDLYAARCALCHGAAGRGDGAVGRALPLPPPDLTAEHVGAHTAGDIFWWITHGIARPGRPAMPAYGGVLDDEARWDLVNAVRFLSDTAAAARLGPAPAATPALVAPDLVHPDLPGPTNTLRGARGRVVLIVLPGPDSRGRLSDLAAAAEPIRRAGGLVVVLGRKEGPEAAAVYRRVRPAGGPTGHAELLIDRQGYLRARWRPGEPGGWDEEGRLVALVAGLASERPSVPPAQAHVH